MKTVKLKIQTKAYKCLEKMGEDAKMSVSEMVAIGAYNLVALWMREKGYIEPLDAPDVMDGDR